MKILLTGANGFVGSHALAFLQSIPDSQLILACRNPSRLEQKTSLEIRKGDLRDPEYLSELCGDIDVLVNAAAWTSAWGHEKQSGQYFYEPVKALYTQALKQGVKKIINISSTSAAAPDTSSDAMSEGIIRNRWPHLNNVIRIENLLRQQAGQGLDVINLRLGLFAGHRFQLGLIPLLLPRLKTHLVPWVAAGKTSAPIVDGQDIGQAIALACQTQLKGYQSFNIVGPEMPSYREVIEFIHHHYHYPRPHFSVPFKLAYGFARTMELLDSVVPWEPLVTRSIVHLMEEVDVNNARAEQYLNYHPAINWRESITNTIDEMLSTAGTAMSMVRPMV